MRVKHGMLRRDCLLASALDMAGMKVIRARYTNAVEFIFGMNPVLCSYEKTYMARCPRICSLEKNPGRSSWQEFVARYFVVSNT